MATLNIPFFGGRGGGGRGLVSTFNFLQQQKRMFFFSKIVSCSHIKLVLMLGCRVVCRFTV